MLHFTNPISCPFGDKAPIKCKSFLPWLHPLSILIAAKNKQAKPQQHFNKCINQQMAGLHQAWVYTNMIKKWRTWLIHLSQQSSFQYDGDHLAPMAGPRAPPGRNLFGPQAAPRCLEPDLLPLDKLTNSSHRREGRWPPGENGSTFGASGSTLRSTLCSTLHPQAPCCLKHNPTSAH